MIMSQSKIPEHNICECFYCRQTHECINFYGADICDWCFVKKWYEPVVEDLRKGKNKL